MKAGIVAYFMLATYKKLLIIFFLFTPDIVSSQEWKPHSTDLNLLHYTVWDTLQELVCEGRCEPYANLEDLQIVITLTDKWYDLDIRQPESNKKFEQSSRNARKPIAVPVRR